MFIQQGIRISMFNTDMYFMRRFLIEMLSAVSWYHAMLRPGEHISQYVDELLQLEQLRFKQRKIRYYDRKTKCENITIF